MAVVVEVVGVVLPRVLLPAVDANNNGPTSKGFFFDWVVVRKGGRQKGMPQSHPKNRCATTLDPSNNRDPIQ